MKRLFFVVITWLLFFSAQIGLSQAADLSKAKAFYKGISHHGIIDRTHHTDVRQLREVKAQPRLIGDYVKCLSGANMKCQPQAVWLGLVV